MRAIRQLYDQQVAFRARQPGLLQDFQGTLGIAEHQANDRAVGQVVDNQGDDANIGRLEATDDAEQSADPVLEEDVKLAHTRPVAAATGRKIDPGAFAGTHGNLPSLEEISV